MKKYQFTINGSKYDVVVNDVDQDVAEIEVNGTPFTVEIAREKKTINVPLRKQAGKVAAQTITPIALGSLLLHPGFSFQLLPLYALALTAGAGIIFIFVTKRIAERTASAPVRKAEVIKLSLF